MLGLYPPNTSLAAYLNRNLKKILIFLRRMPFSRKKTIVREHGIFEQRQPGRKSFVVVPTKNLKNQRDKIPPAADIEGEGENYS